MARWSAQDLARVSARIQSQIGAPLETRSALPPKESSKYRNQKVVVDGYQFDSKLEAKRYQELQLLQKSGAISELEFHKHWDLHVNNIMIGYYEADFTYRENGNIVIEDAKGVMTPLYRWKKKHVLAEYGIEIREINA